MLKLISLVIQAAFYMLAGFNHFKNPRVYLKVMPSYIPFPVTMINLSGAAEMLLGLLLFFPRTRAFAGLGISLMLIAFIPVHIDMIQHAPMQLGALQLPASFAWVRLALQFVLIAWIWFATH